jgi:hypothetical protein
MRHDFASKHWLRKYRRPLWLVLAHRFCQRSSLARMRSNPLPSGVKIELESDGLEYIRPAPAR